MFDIIGAYGYVYKVQRTSDSKMFALKKMIISKDNSNARSAYQQEISTMVRKLVTLDFNRKRSVLIQML